jgi:hypothetical protein
MCGKMVICAFYKLRVPVVICDMCSTKEILLELTTHHKISACVPSTTCIPVCTCTTTGSRKRVLHTPPLQVYLYIIFSPSCQIQTFDKQCILFAIISPPISTAPQWWSRSHHHSWSTGTGWKCSSRTYWTAASTT